MKCRRARKLIHELLDGALADRAQLDRHLDECAACRAELRALEPVESAVRGVVETEVPEEALERITAGVLPALATPQPQTTRAAHRWVVALAAAALAMFFLGLGAGRWAWRRERVVREVVRVPEVREVVKEVEVRVPVPVVEERVVVKRVPVYKTRVLPAEDALAHSYGAGAKPPAPVKLDPVVVHLGATPALPGAKLVQEARPARLAEEDGGGEGA